MVALTAAYFTPPSLKITATALGLEINVPGQSWAATVALAIAVSWLGVLELRNDRKQRRWATYDALGRYVEMLQRGSTKGERVDMLREFNDDQAIDEEIFPMCQIVELLLPGSRSSDEVSASRHNDVP